MRRRTQALGALILLLALASCGDDASAPAPQTTASAPRPAPPRTVPPAPKADAGPKLPAGRCRLTIRVTRDGVATEARVTLVAQRDTRSRDTDRIWFADDLDAPVAGTDVARAADESLRYIAEGLAPGGYVVTATAADGSTARDESVALRADGESASIELKLAPAVAHGVLRGRVKGLGATPFRGLVAIHARSEGHGEFSDDAWRPVAEEGSFVLDVPERGRVAVAALVPGKLRAVGPEVALPSDAAYELDLSKLLSPLRVHVTDEATGKPVEGAEAGACSRWGTSTLSVERTDADGRCTLWASPGKRTLYVRAAGYPDVSDLEVPSTETEVELPLVAGPSVRVRVTRADDGSAVAGAPVYVRHYGPNGVSGWASPTPTGADGTALVSGLVPGEVFVFVLGEGWFSEGLELGRVTGEGWSVNNRWPARPPDSISASGTTEIALRVFPALALEGTVRRNDGTPVAGAIVEARAAGMLPHLGQTEESGFDAAPVVTGADGRFRVEGLYPPASYHLSATAEGEPGTAACDADAKGPGPVELRFAVPHFVDADVRDATSGAALAGASVSIRPPRNVNDLLMHLDVLYATTASDGSARVGPAIAGEYEALVTARGYLVVAPQSLRLTDGATDGPRLQFRLVPGAVIRGHAVLEGGTAIEEGSVGVEHGVDELDEMLDEAWSARAALGKKPFDIAADGSFEIAGVKPGEHTLRAVAKCGERQFEGSARARTDGSEVLIRLEPVAGRDPLAFEHAYGPTFGLRVLGPDGRAVGRAWIAARWSAGRNSMSGNSFEVMRGAVQVPLGIRGTTVTVSGAKSLNGVPLHAATQSFEIPRDAADGHEIRLGRGEVLAGSVTDESGAAVRGVRVSARLPMDPDDPFGSFGRLSKEMIESTVSGSDGAFELRRLGRDEYEVVCETPPDFEPPAVVRVRGGTRDLAIHLVRGLRPVVTVLDDAGAPVAEASVSVSAGEVMVFGGVASAETGSDGRVTLPAIASGGSYRLIVIVCGRNLDGWSGAWKPEAQTTIRLARLLKLSGRVLASDGEPAGGVAVCYSPTDPAGTEPEPSSRSWEKVVTDADGRFSIDELRTPAVSIVAGAYSWSHFGFNGMSHALDDAKLVGSVAQTVKTGATDVELRLIPAHLIRVKIAGLRSSLTKDELPWLLSTGDHRETLTPIATKDPDVVLFSGVSPEREYDLFVRIPRQGLIGRLSGVKAGKDASITLEEGTTLSGRLLLPDGARIDSATVEFNGGGFEVREETGSDGRFLIPCLPRVDGELRAWSYMGSALGGSAKATPGTPVEVRMEKGR